MFIASLQTAFARKSSIPDPITAAVSAAKQANEVACAKLSETFRRFNSDEQKKEKP